MKNNKMLVVVLLLFIVAVFGWIGYTLFFPKSSIPVSRRNFYSSSVNFERALNMKVPLDFVKSVSVGRDFFSPLIVKLNNKDFVSLLKTTFTVVKVDPSIKYLSGVKSKTVNMVTLLIGNDMRTLDFNRSQTHFSWKKQNYVLVYFDPTYEGAVIMNVSNGRLYVVTSRGLIMNEGEGQ